MHPTSRESGRDVPPGGTGGAAAAESAGTGAGRGRRLRLVIYSLYYPPETGGSQARLHDLAVRLRRQGHEVTVLTALPSYPAGRVFDGYRGKLTFREEMEGVRVIRTAAIPSRSTRTVPRLLNCLSFAASSLLLAAARLPCADVLIFESPPPFLAPSAVVLARLLGAKLVMNLSDVWPDILVRMGSLQPGRALDAMLRLERFAYRHSDVLAFTNPGEMRQVQERFPGVAATVISTGVDTELFRHDRRSEAVRQELGAGPETILAAYCGLLGAAQGLESLLRAADLLRHDERIRFVVMGDGPERERLHALAAELKLPNLRILERRPQAEVANVLAAADIALAPLRVRLPGTMPSKIYEALASGLPVVVARGCEGEGLVREFKVGRTYEPMDAAGLAEAVSSLAEEARTSAMRERCRALALRFSIDAIAERTGAMLEAVADGRPLPPVQW